MFRPPTTEEVDSELRDLEVKLLEYNKLIERKQTLLEYKAVLAKMNPNGAKVAEDVPSPSQVPTLGTVEAARRVLASVPEMQIGNIVLEARRIGWHGSGNDRTDKNRFFAAMYRKKDLFERSSNGAWKLRK
ncbi:MAG: hypothetical protein M1404_05690 [Acidobacteria bacterium]|nr:hypothetical protein [Acidobacteriota bacterium]